MNSPAASDALGSPRKTRGRPRGVDVDARILEAAATVFASEGWRGFYFEAIAKAAGVGKSTIYLRWNNREELMVDVLRAYGHNWADPDTGDIREDLRGLALEYGRKLDGEGGPVGLRMFVESYMNPEYAAVAGALTQGAVADSHGIIRRAKRRGQLRADAPAAVILDSLLGAVMQHLTMVSPRVPGGLYSSPQGIAFVDRLVDTLLSAHEIS